jgi:hypothetical protein
MTLQLLVIYVPALQRIFSTTPLSPQDWVAVLISALLPIAVMDGVKVWLAGREQQRASRA